MRQKAPRVRVTVYEKDSSPFSRPQGYALGIKADTGLPALRDLGLERSVLGSETVKVTDFSFTDERGRILMALRPSKDEDKYTTYRVQRRLLKGTLLDALGDTEVRYGDACTGFERHGDHPVALLESGGRIECDYLVAADGVRSAIRSQMIGDQPRFLKLAAICGDARILPDHPLLSGGYFIALGSSGSSFFCYAQPGQSVHFSCTLRVDAPDALSALTQDELLERVRQETSGWFDLVTSIVDNVDPPSIGVRDYLDRNPIKRIRAGRMWLLGDAAHPMSPFQGQGANCALLHGVRLADLFSAARMGTEEHEQLTKEIESEMVDRASKFVIESRSRARQLHATNRFSQAMRNLGFRMANTFKSASANG
jgi:2-polyprenyl-6-methoxyphenol hydroxylase-like FAD-dependent oxidoreductase